jgi:hypothetical protein
MRYLQPKRALAPPRHSFLPFAFCHFRAKADQMAAGKAACAPELITRSQPPRPGLLEGVLLILVAVPVSCERWAKDQRLTYGNV